MEAALSEARKAAEAGEVPIGAVAVHNGAIIASGQNRVLGLRPQSRRRRFRPGSPQPPPPQPPGASRARPPRRRICGAAPHLLPHPSLLIETTVPKDRKRVPPVSRPGSPRTGGNPLGGPWGGRPAVVRASKPAPHPSQRIAFLSEVEGPAVVLAAASSPLSTDRGAPDPVLRACDFF